jgi:hypothetical protein
MRPGVAHVLGICAVPGTAGASPAVSVERRLFLRWERRLPAGLWLRGRATIFPRRRTMYELTIPYGDDVLFSTSLSREGFDEEGDLDVQPPTRG